MYSKQGPFDTVTCPPTCTKWIQICILKKNPFSGYWTGGPPLNFQTKIIWEVYNWIHDFILGSGTTNIGLGSTGGTAQRIYLQKLQSGPHTKSDWVNKSVQLHMLTHFNGSTTDLYILTCVTKYTEINQADISSLNTVQILHWVTKLTQLSHLQNLLSKLQQAHRHDGLTACEPKWWICPKSK